MPESETPQTEKGSSAVAGSSLRPRALEQRILQSVGRANRDFGLIAPGDRILVAVSGGKDSLALLWVLRRMRAASNNRFDLVAFHLDQGQPGHDTSKLEPYLAATGVPYEIERQDTYSRVISITEPGKTYCSLCSRFRRAILYRAATRHGCNKVALGHHREDLIETLLLSIFFSGQIKSMPAKLRADDGQHEIIRPLCYVPEAQTRMLAQLHEMPVMPCGLCGSQETERKFIKELLEKLGEHTPHIKGNLLAALGQVHVRHLLDPRHNPLYPAAPADEPADEPADR